VTSELECGEACDECGKCRGHISSGYTSICSEVRCQCPYSVRTSPAFLARMPFTEQLALVAPHIAEAAAAVAPDDVDADEIARMAIERFSGIGAAEHGDAMFHLTAEQLRDEELAEYADAAVYRARRIGMQRVQEAIDA